MPLPELRKALVRPTQLLSYSAWSGLLSFRELKRCQEPYLSVHDLVDVDAHAALERTPRLGGNGEVYQGRFKVFPVQEAGAQVFRTALIIGMRTARNKPLPP